MENLHYLEITETVLVLGNIVNDDYQQNSRVLCKLPPNKIFSQLLDISPKNFIYLKTFHLEFSYIEVLFTTQIFKYEKYKKSWVIKLNLDIEYLRL